MSLDSFPPPPPAYARKPVPVPQPVPQTIQPVPVTILPSPDTIAVVGGARQVLPSNGQLSPAFAKMAQRLMDYIGDDDSSEILMNGPAEISRKVRGIRTLCSDLDFETGEIYHQVINEAILRYTDTEDRIDHKTVILEGQLELPTPGKAPMLARVHVIAPPGVLYAKVTIAKKPRFELTLNDLAQNGTLSQNEADFLNASVKARRTIVVSGPTGSGKTTLLQALTHCFNPNDRVVVVEETPELRLPLTDVVYLRATLERPGLSADQVFDLGFWTKQANRMRMDRVIVGETRGAELADWLLAANSGAEGSATTVHANTPRRALDKILALATKSSSAPSEHQLQREIAVTIDLIVQIGLVEGRHLITAIEEVSDTVSQQANTIQTNTIFAFDNKTGQHVAKARPNDEYLEALAAHGYPAKMSWFAA